MALLAGPADTSPSPLIPILAERLKTQAIVCAALPDGGMPPTTAAARALTDLGAMAVAGVPARELEKAVEGFSQKYARRGVTRALLVVDGSPGRGREIDGVSLERLVLLTQRGPISLLLVGQTKGLAALIRSAPGSVRQAITTYETLAGPAHARPPARRHRDAGADLTTSYPMFQPVRPDPVARPPMITGGRKRSMIEILSDLEERPATAKRAEPLDGGRLVLDQPVGDRPVGDRPVRDRLVGDPDDEFALPDWPLPAQPGISARRHALSWAGVGGIALAVAATAFMTLEPRHDAPVLHVADKTGTIMASAIVAPPEPAPEPVTIAAESPEPGGATRTLVIEDDAPEAPPPPEAAPLEPEPAANSATPEIARPDALVPDVAAPDVATPDAIVPELGPSAVEPPETDMAEPPAPEFQAREPEPAVPELAEPEPAEPELVEPELAEPALPEPSPLEALPPEPAPPESVAEPEPMPEAAPETAVEPSPDPPPEAVAEPTPTPTPEPETIPTPTTDPGTSPTVTPLPEPAPAPAAALEPPPPPPEPPPPAPPPAPVEAPVPTIAEGLLLDRGDRFLAIGDIASARLLFESAAAQGSARGALALGRTLDPGYLRSVGARGVTGDPDRAATWYRKAAALGEPSAAGLLEALGQR
ncbi:hypothetical protein N825_20635 [Skermanella stibiiresistens SB22]|uniref:Uncharacterized protein n=1 Tax=Skermanella stibiiresistens SB22 TaxID=1385369 RepID=W9H0M6_9PROT|nr:hypothetical protein N825_20635 [Skermanella stibiiresistens SB22]